MNRCRLLNHNDGMTTPSHPAPHRQPMSLEEKEEQYRLAIEAAEVGLWDVDVRTNHLFWPARVKAMFGISPEVEVSLADFYDGLHPDDRAHTMLAFERAQDPLIRAVYDVEYRTIGKEDHRLRWVAAKGRALFDEQGQCTRILGTVIDITARKEAEARWHEDAARLAMLDRIGQATRSLTDAMELMAVTARLLGEHLGASRCAYADVEADNDRFTIRSDWSMPGLPSSVGVYSLDLFGPQATFLLRQGRTLVVHDVDRELGDEGGGRMFNAIGIKAIICAGLVKQGRLMAMMAVHQTMPRLWSPGEIGIVEEVVDRCWAHIERVRDAAALAEQDRRKDEFLATLAHELRNPIAPLRYATALLKSVDTPSRHAQAQDVIERQSGHLARLIDDLLDVSRINRGLIELRREVVPVSNLLLQAVEASKSVLDRAGHRLTLQLPDDTAKVDADPTRIVQAVTNLLNNAAKYTPDGGEVRLSAWVSGTKVLIEVVDNGVGIPPQDQGKLFQLFTQLPHTGARTQGGLGIGLSLVKRLVEMHGGQARLHSAGLDEGSTFTLELPLVVPVPEKEAVPPSMLDEKGKGRILVVEDNEDGLETLMMLLEAEGHEVRGAGSGAKALEIVASWQPQVVLLDLGLPRMDGYEVAARLRAVPGLGQARLVALTGWGAQKDREKTAAAGFDAHLVKPIDPEVLLRSLDEFLQVVK
ncbi:MAG: response regulator [Rubrivivax sp.]|nr:MAG: response regulator [Rubrivivax sp.]